MLTYDQMWETVSDPQDVSVLLGNGFSRACRDRPFQYSTLFDAAQFGERADSIRGIFDALETHDFETVNTRLRAATSLLPFYDVTPGRIEQIESDIDTIKDALVQAISDTHPRRPNEIQDTEYQCARRFLSSFRRIYTVNYDLLMYWARNQDAVPPEHWDTDDGFRKGGLWVGPDTDQDVFFLHGALHLYETREGVKKHTFSRRGEPIVDTVRKNLRRDVFPLFVSEPSSDLKLRRINKNPYLSCCLRKLRQTSGDLLVFGHSLTEVDQHIFKTVDRSNIGNVFVAVRGDEYSDNNRAVKAKAQAWLERPRRAVYLVDAETIPAWQPV